MEYILSDATSQKNWIIARKKLSRKIINDIETLQLTTITKVFKNVI